jgi:hypothetical protein
MLFPFTGMWDNYTRIQPNIENKWITDCTFSGKSSKSSGKSPKHITNQKECYQNKKQKDSRKILYLGQESRVGWSLVNTKLHKSKGEGT